MADEVTAIWAHSPLLQGLRKIQKMTCTLQSLVTRINNIQEHSDRVTMIMTVMTDGNGEDDDDKDSHIDNDDEGALQLMMRSVHAGQGRGAAHACQTFDTSAMAYRDHS